MKFASKALFSEDFWRQKTPLRILGIQVCSPWAWFVMQAPPTARSRAILLVPLLIVVLSGCPRPLKGKDAKIWWIAYLLACLSAAGMAMAGSNYPLAWACGAALCGSLGMGAAAQVSPFLHRQAQPDKLP